MPSHLGLFSHDVTDLESLSTAQIFGVLESGQTLGYIEHNMRRICTEWRNVNTCALSAGTSLLVNSKILGCSWNEVLQPLLHGV